MAAHFKIASYNMKDFGFDSIADRNIDKIAEIIAGEKFDVVALQEIFSEGKGIEYLCQRLGHMLDRWEYRWALPESSGPEQFEYSGTVDPVGRHSSTSEGYAFLWNARKLELLTYEENGEKRTFEPRILNKSGEHINCSCFFRVPYYVRLQPKPGWGGFIELRLVNVHIYSGNRSNEGMSDVIVPKRQLEYKLIMEEVYPKISTYRYGTFRPAYTIVMGDYNLNLVGPDGNRYPQINEVTYQFECGTQEATIRTEQSELTTLKMPDRQTGVVNGYASNFDHFTYSAELSPFSSVRISRVDAVNKYCDGDATYYRKYISDHLPIVMEVQI